MMNLVTPASAVTVVLDFTVNGGINGQITYQAPTLNGDISSLSAISLTIDSHDYTLGEVGFISPWQAGQSLIGGILNGVDSVVDGTDDFVLLFNPSSSSGLFFTYTTSAHPLDEINTVGSFTLTELRATPLPAALPLFTTGLGALGLLGWRRKKKAAVTAA
jgi:hypothetical protein